jgi:hypothetical protein
MIKFRWQRGSLEDSLATAKEFDSLKEFFDYIMNSDLIINMPCRLGQRFIPGGLYKKINITYYGYDKRCKQELFIVTIKDTPLTELGKSSVIGFIFEER